MHKQQERIYTAVFFQISTTKVLYYQKETVATAGPSNWCRTSQRNPFSFSYDSNVSFSRSKVEERFCRKS